MGAAGEVLNSKYPYNCVIQLKVMSLFDSYSKFLDMPAVDGSEEDATKKIFSKTGPSRLKLLHYDFSY